MKYLVRVYHVLDVWHWARQKEQIKTSDPRDHPPLDCVLSVWSRQQTHELVAHAGGAEFAEKG